MKTTDQELNALHSSKLPLSLQQKVTAARQITDSYGLFVTVSKGDSIKDRYKNTWTVFSVVAFFFMWIPYMIRGMWKKGLVFLGIQILAIVISMIFYPSSAVNSAMNIVVLCLNILAATSYFNDLWRKYAQGQDFWW